MDESHVARLIISELANEPSLPPSMHTIAHQSMLAFTILVSYTFALALRLLRRPSHGLAAAPRCSADIEGALLLNQYRPHALT